MLRGAVLFAVAGILAMGSPSKSPSAAGFWQVDARHSDAQLITDATTDYGKTKIDITLGFARVNGRVALDNDLSKASFDFRLYPATGMSPAIDEDGKFLSHWLANLSNHTLICFHSKGALRTPDGRLQTTGDLVLTRVDRNVDATPSEAYSGPVYGPPMIHRISRQATFVFDFPAAAGKDQKDAATFASGSARMFREDYPQLVTTALNTYWPPVVQDQNCQAPASVGEDYHGSVCTGTLLMAPGLPDSPQGGSGEDLGTPQNADAVVGNRLTILVHLRLMAKASAEQAGAGN
ncbi:MAG: hypothetical protein WAM89_09925 [Terriglobales bacterium]